MYSRSTGEVNSNRIMSSLLRKWTRLPTHAHEVRALTFKVTDNFGSNDVLPCGAYGPWSLPAVGKQASIFPHPWLLRRTPPPPAMLILPKQAVCRTCTDHLVRWDEETRHAHSGLQQDGGQGRQMLHWGVHLYGNLGLDLLCRSLCQGWHKPCRLRIDNTRQLQAM